MDSNDHRVIGNRLDLFHQQEEGPGMVFWHPRGAVLYRLIEDTIARRMRRSRLQRGAHPAAPCPLAVGAQRPLGEIRRRDVRGQRRRARLRPQADELPRPHPDLQQPRALVARAAGAAARVRRVPPQRAVRLAARPDAHPRLRAGRRPHLLPRGPDRRRGRAVLPHAARRLRRFRLRRRSRRLLDKAGRARRRRTRCGTARRAPSRRQHAPPGSTTATSPAKASSTGPSSNSSCATAASASGSAAPSSSTSCCPSGSTRSMPTRAGSRSGRR